MQTVAKNTILSPLEKLKPFISEQTILVRSPGRINLIGEHTDYNEGYVLPAAIDKAAYLALTPRADNQINLFSIDLEDQYSGDIHDFERTEKSWPNYILGVADQFRQRGKLTSGFDAALTADVPIGAGLSSSAAVENAVVMALDAMLDTGYEKLTMVKMSQKAEHTFPRLMCGIMDMFASMFGKKNNVIRLDCRSLEYAYEPLDMSDFKIVLFDSNVEHSLGSSEYNVRRAQCEEGVALVKQYYPHVLSLRDVTMDMLNKYVLPVNELVYRRCSYVLEENARLLAACEYLEEGDMQAFGKKMYESHEGLSKKYEVSCKELDFLVEQVKNNPDVLGARMMGGGFGGCTINLVKEGAVESLIAEITKAYKAATGLDTKAYITKIEDGTTIL
ncbi:galactokinase [Ilyomonas limi]|uniref:Galactokinase n=1 Tax=Ilyomonas limi TaxID=2575867 RepID=A0A4U3L707_9BACT|nr:galactokinase [Ilyomonas limi]TKK70229.1 galactokinase [Ilyomonas limi]